MSARPKLMQKQVMAIGKILEAHITSNDDGTAVYEVGWSDERVLAEARGGNTMPDHPISLSAIAKMRLNVFGRVRPARVPRPAPSNGEGDLLRAKISTLGGRLDALEKEHEEFIASHNRLLEWARSVSERRGYAPPPGRPQSTPPSPPANGSA